MHTHTHTHLYYLLVFSMSLSAVVDRLRRRAPLPSASGRHCVSAIALTGRLSPQRGEIITMVSKDDKRGVYSGEIGTRRGEFPAESVQLILNNSELQVRHMSRHCVISHSAGTYFGLVLFGAALCQFCLPICRKTSIQAAAGIDP